MKKLILAIACLALALAALPADAGETWTFPVLNRTPALLPLEELSKTKLTPATYTSLSPEDVAKKWHFCLCLPNMADPYYVAMNYGAVEESKRLGLQMTLYSAGGYVNLDKQINQVEDCVAQGVDAIILMGISPQGLTEAIKDAHKRGIVIVDVVNGMDSPELSARIKTSYYVSGKAIGEYLAGRHPKGSGETEVLWLPGPPGATWSEDLSNGLHDALDEAEADIVLAATLFGDTHKDAQLKLVEDGLITYPNIKYIAGSPQAVEVGYELLREQGRQDDVGLVSSWITPAMYKGIEEGWVLATTTESIVMTTRIAVDTVVRILEGKPYFKDTGTAIGIVDTDTISSFDRALDMAPDGWRPTFQIN